jgi:perosamine synthetase
VRFPTYLGRGAIALLCRIWGIGTEDEVLLPSYNCGSEVSPFLAAGCRVVFYRVDGQGRIDAEDIRRRTAARTRVIYVTHYFGWAQDLSDTLAWCRERGVLLVEDCAYALFTTGKDGPPGQAGDAAIFSFRKCLPVPHGGMLLLRDSTGSREVRLRTPQAGRTLRDTLPLLRTDFLRKLDRVGLYSPLRKRSLRSRQEAFETVARESGDMVAENYYRSEVGELGMSRLAAGILRTTDAREVVRRRRENYAQLSEDLRGVAGLTPLFHDLPEGVCPAGLPLIVEERTRLARSLIALGIVALPFWEGYHRGLSWDEFPEARRLKEKVLLMPVHQDLGARHIRFISETLTILVRSFASKTTVVL